MNTKQHSLCAPWRCHHKVTNNTQTGYIWGRHHTMIALPRGCAWAISEVSVQGTSWPLYARVTDEECTHCHRPKLWAPVTPSPTPWCRTPGHSVSIPVLTRKTAQWQSTSSRAPTTWGPHTRGQRDRPAALSPTTVPTSVHQVDLVFLEDRIQLSHHVPEAGNTGQVFPNRNCAHDRENLFPSNPVTSQQDQFQVKTIPGDWWPRPKRLKRMQKEFQNLICSAKCFYLRSLADCSWHRGGGLNFQTCSPGKKTNK